MVVVEEEEMMEVDVGMLNCLMKYSDQMGPHIDC